FQNVKFFAARLAHEHASSVKTRSHLAESMEVVPQESHPALAMQRMHTESKKNLLSKKFGCEFDEAYIKYQIMLHEEIIDLLEDTEDSMDHPDLRQHLRFSRPDMLSHLSAARAVERQLVAQH